MTASKNNITQYLHWALSEAHAVEDPDCREVHIVIRTDRRHSVVSYVKKDAPEGTADPKVLTDVLDIVHTALTGPEKFNRQGCINLIHKALRTFRGEKS